MKRLMAMELARAARRRPYHVTEADTAADYSLVYIFGPGHCGSTLLNLLLNGHPEVVALSEVRELGKQGSVGNRDEPAVRHIWAAAKERFEHRAAASFDTLTLKDPEIQTSQQSHEDGLRSWGELNHAFFSAFAEASDSRFVVDASKSWRRLYLLHRSLPVPIKVINLMRDGRAVLNSYRRKTYSFRDSFTRWAVASSTGPFLRRRFAHDDWLRIRYEDLATDPRTTLTEICDFLGVDFDKAMLSFREHPSVWISGNKMRHRQDREIIPDTRWTAELSLRDRLTFGLLGGWLNKYHGY